MSLSLKEQKKKQQIKEKKRIVIVKQNFASRKWMWEICAREIWNPANCRREIRNPGLRGIRNSTND